MRIVILLLAIFLYLSAKKENMMYMTMPKKYYEYQYSYHVGTDGIKRLDQTGANIYHESKVKRKKY